MTKRIFFVDTPSSRQLRNDSEDICAMVKDYIHIETAQLMAEGKLDANGNVIAAQNPTGNHTVEVQHAELKRPKQ